MPAEKQHFPGSWAHLAAGYRLAGETDLNDRVDPPAGAGGHTGAVRARWGLGDALVGFLVGLVVSTLAVLAALGGSRLPASASQPTGVVIANLLGLWVGLVGAPVVASRLKGTGSLRTDFGFELRPWPDVPIGIAVGLASQLVLLPLLYLPFHALVPHLDQRLDQPARQITGASTGAALVAVALLLSVGAPVVEELFFRGLVQRSVEKTLMGLVRRRSRRSPGRPAPGQVDGDGDRGPAGTQRALGGDPTGAGEGAGVARRWAARASIVVSAVLFGLAHAQSLQLLGLVAFGIVLGVLARVSGRLGPGMVTHCVFNTVALVGVLAVV